MANEEHLAILRQGVEVWNKWRDENPHVFLDLSDSSLVRANLRGINLNHVSLSNSNLYEADLIGANLGNAFLTDADLSKANLTDAFLSGADVRDTDLIHTNLARADLTGVNLSGAKMWGTNLSEANLQGAEFYGTSLLETNFEGANLSGCRVYGISAWKLRTEGAIQTDLVITYQGEPVVTVDNIEIAQFVYLLLNNQKLRHVIDTLTTKSVLILGRFTPERKAVLDAIRGELRNRGYVPILFDFEQPANRDLTETVMTLASLSRFVIADLSDPNSIPHELMSFAEKLLSVPVKPVFCPTLEHPKPYPMLEHLQRYPHVLSTYFYDTSEHLIAALAEQVIAPAEAKANAMRP